MPKLLHATQVKEKRQLTDTRTNMHRHNQEIYMTDETWVHPPMLFLCLHLWALLALKTCRIWAEPAQSPLQPSGTKPGVWRTRECMCLPLWRNLEWMTPWMLIFGKNKDCLCSLADSLRWFHDWLDGLYTAFPPNTHSEFLSCMEHIATSWVSCTTTTRRVNFFLIGMEQFCPYKPHHKPGGGGPRRMFTFPPPPG